MQGYKSVFIDFDSTLFDVDLFFHTDARRIVMEHNIDLELWDRSYEEVLPRGYTLEKHVKKVRDVSGGHYSLDALTKSFAKKFHSLEKYVFADVKPFLGNLRSKGHHIFLVSFGAEEWQREKVSKSSLSDYFDDILFTKQECSKAERILERTIADTQIVFIDNSPKELDAVVSEIEDVQTYLINRVPCDAMTYNNRTQELRWLEARRHAKTRAKRSHTYLTSLDAKMF